MKAKLVAGLVAIALGGFTSCGNILEENGVINNVAQNGTGELRINLVADGSLNVTTKATESISTEGIDTQNFDVTATLTTGSTTVTGKASEFPKTVAAGTYNVTAKLDQMGGKALAWDKPSFSGSAESVEVSGAGTGKANITATLSNSLITLDQASISNLSDATITEIFVYEGDATYSSEEKFPLYTNSGSSSTTETKKLFVAAGKNNIYMHISGKLNDASSTPISQSTKIAGQLSGESVSNKDQTYAKNNYKVTYSLVKDKGQLALSITLNGEVNIVPLSVNINPYE